MKTVDFTETIAACDLKVGRYRQLIELMKVVSIEGQCHFLTLTQGHLHMKNLNWLFSQTFLTKFCMKAFRYTEMKIYQHDAGHMTKMAPMPIYGKTLRQSSSQEPVDRFPRNLICSICDSGTS